LHPFGVLRDALRDTRRGKQIKARLETALESFVCDGSPPPVSVVWRMIHAIHLSVSRTRCFGVNSYGKLWKKSKPMLGTQRDNAELPHGSGTTLLSVVDHLGAAQKRAHAPKNPVVFATFERAFRLRRGR
jgi:hypothetical protein